MKRALATIALVAASQVAHAESRSSGPLSIVVPDAVLGRDTSVVLTARASLVHWVTSAGELSAPTIDGGSQRVTLTLPAAKYPQVAIVAALDERGMLVDWIAVPLAGRAMIRVETSASADVVVDVAGMRTAPVRASTTGIAEVAIVVPPGITEVRTIATTRRGATIEKSQTLGVPPVKTLLATCREDRITAIATTSTGARAERTPVITAASGTLAPVTAAPGIAAATFVSAHPEATSDEQVTLTASIDQQRATCELTVHHEPAPVVPAAPAPPRVVRAPSPPQPRFSVTPRVGLLTNLGRITTPYASLSLAARVSAHLVVDASVGGYTTAIDEMSSDGVAISGRLTAIPGVVRLSYRRSLGPIDAWLGAGGGLASATSRVTSTLGSAHVTTLVPAAEVAAGIGHRLGPGRLAVEAGYLHATLDEALSGRIGGITTSVGFGIDL